jgi:TnpA family transposase
MKQVWAEDEIMESFTLSLEEKIELWSKTEATRLGFAILLKAFQVDWGFPRKKNEIPQSIVDYVARQCEVNAEKFEEYALDERQARRHREQIRIFLGITEYTKEHGATFKVWVCEQLLPTTHNEETIESRAIEWFRSQLIEAPPPTDLEDLIRGAIYAWEKALFEKVVAALTQDQKAKIDALLISSQDEEEPVEEKRTKRKRKPIVINSFFHLRKGPGKLGLNTIIEETQKLGLARSISVPMVVISHLGAHVLSKYRRRVAIQDIYDAKRSPDLVRYAQIALFATIRTAEITDAICDVLIQIVHKLSSRSESAVKKEVLKEIGDFQNTDSALKEICKASLAKPKGTVDEVIFPVVSESEMKDLLLYLSKRSPAFQVRVHEKIRASFKNHYRRMIPIILTSLNFRSNNTLHRPIIDGLALLKRHAGDRSRYLSCEEEGILSSLLKKTLHYHFVELDEKGKERINRISFEVCLLQSLREGLRCREVWVEGGFRYRDPDEDLPSNFDEKREEYYRLLGLSTDADAFVASIKADLEKALKALNASLPQNKKVKITKNKKTHQGWIHLTPLEEQPEPKNLVKIKAEVKRRWPDTSLLDMLKEADLRIDFTSDFKSAGKQNFLDKMVLRRRLLSVLFCLGTNTGVSAAEGRIPGEKIADLLHVKKYYISKEFIRSSIAKVANATFKVRQEKIWGAGSTSCASDSKKFGAWDQNIRTEHSVRYGGRGVMIYWHVETNSVCIYSKMKTCSSSEVVAMIEGVLRHGTEMNVKKNYVDSHGQSEIAFAFTHLLGFKLMPRLKGIARQKLSQADADQKLENIEPILSRVIDWDLIRKQFDEMVKYAVALRLGTADTDSILHRFSKDNLRHPTYQALMELGKAIKTIFLCQYLESEEMRQEIHEGLNVVEQWNSVNGFIFYGKNQDVSTNDLEQQEICLLGLHLIQSCIVYINTIMLQDVLRDDDVLSLMGKTEYRALTPLFYRHINPYGRFELDFNERLPLMVERDAA